VFGSARFPEFDGFLYRSIFELRQRKKIFKRNKADLFQFIVICFLAQGFKGNISETFDLGLMFWSLLLGHKLLDTHNNNNNSTAVSVTTPPLAVSRLTVKCNICRKDLFFCCFFFSRFFQPIFLLLDRKDGISIEVAFGDPTMDHKA